MVRRAGAALLALVLLVTPALAQEDQNDPLEPLNRGIFQFNRCSTGCCSSRPRSCIAWSTPQFVRTGVRNFLANLTTPVVLANDLLQGEFERAELTLGRFMMNTILGVGGVIDVGGKLGMPDRHYEDFGQTLAVYGVGSGPYLMLPLLGPSNGRDAIGRVVDLGVRSVLGSGGGRSRPSGVDRNSPWPAGAPRSCRSARATLEQIDELERSSIDLYAAVRTLYGQFRANEIRNGAVAEIDDIYDEGLYDDPEALDEDPADVYEDPEAADAD